MQWKLHRREGERKREKSVLGHSRRVVGDKCPHPLARKVNALNFCSQIHARHATQRASYERGRYLRHVPRTSTRLGHEKLQFCFASSRLASTNLDTSHLASSRGGTSSYVTSFQITWPIVRPLPEMYFSELWNVCGVWPSIEGCIGQATFCESIAHTRDVSSLYGTWSNRILYISTRNFSYM